MRSTLWRLRIDLRGMMPKSVQSRHPAALIDGAAGPAE